MCTRCPQWCVEVIFYRPTVKLHLCFQHQLPCFMGWLQQMCGSGLSFPSTPSVTLPPSPIFSHSSPASIHNHQLILSLLVLCLQRRIPFWCWTTVGSSRWSLWAFWRRQSLPFSLMPTLPPKWRGWKTEKTCWGTTMSSPKQATLKGIGEKKIFGQSGLTAVITVKGILTKEKHSNICMLNVKLKPGEHYLSLIKRLEIASLALFYNPPTNTCKSHSSTLYIYVYSIQKPK